MSLIPSEGGSLTPDLIDLMEHEKTIEQGVGSMIDMGYAFEKIRDGRKYKAAGYPNFDTYCQDRWQMARRRVDEAIKACRLARELPRVSDKPPTFDISQAVPVKPKAPPTKDHPAPFSDPILDQVTSHLKEVGQSGTVIDPFAGTGRVHELREKAGVHTVGVELEPEWAAKHPDTIEGNALELTNTFEPGSVDAIATSPTYGNRMADHHDAKDDSVRLTYKHTLGRDLHDDNSGQLQWGDEYRRFHQIAWTEAVAALKPGGTLTLNIKNHFRDGQQQRVAEWHLNTLYELGVHLVALDIVPTKGLMAGANADNRTIAEYVMTFRKEP